MGVYSSTQIDFIIIAIVNSAARSFLKRTHGRTHVPTPGKLTYRGGTGPPKKVYADVEKFIADAVSNEVVTKLQVCREFVHTKKIR